MKSACGFLGLQRWAVLACAILFTASLRGKEEAKIVMVHYMPWFASKEVSGHWGWHWTMNRFNPDRMKEHGQRAVASHEYPLIGLYDSNDPDTLECHALLMKFAGVDGAIIDWYGIRKFRDYAEIHRNTLHFVKHLKRAGLQFAICYEDQTVRHMIEGKALPRQEALAHGKKVMRWLDQNWFADKSYLRMAGRPALFVFGPQYYQKRQWESLLTGLSNRPLFLALPHMTSKAGADGSFGWPPVHGGRKVKSSEWGQYLKDLHARGAKGEPIVSVAFPGFHDFYQEAGVHDSYGFIDARKGKTLEESLELAWRSEARIIQVATWNDFGEGTMIEPTQSGAYQSLEIIQKKVKPKNLRPDDLRLPVLLYQLKKKHARNAKVMKELQESTNLLFAGKCDAAQGMLEKLASEAIPKLNP